MSYDDTRLPSRSGSNSGSNSGTTESPRRNPVTVGVTTSALIEDIRALYRKNPSITRNFYRANGTYSEHSWQRFYSRFSDFLTAAGLPVATAVQPPFNASGSGHVPGPGNGVNRGNNGNNRVGVEVPESSEMAGDKWTITLPKTRISTLDELLEHAKVDLSLWEVERFVVNKWEVGTGTGDASKGTKAIVVEPLFQVKATLRKRVEMLAVLAEIAALKLEAKREARVPYPVDRQGTAGKESGNLLEILIPDLHAAKLAWSKETGHKDYNTQIATDTYRRAIDRLLQDAAPYKIDRIVLGVGNDLLQADNIQGTTNSGTKVDTDTRYHKTYVTVRKMLCETVEKLRQIAPVEVKIVPGNHDTLSAFTMGDSLECYFDRYTDVHVDNAPLQHKTVEWGKNLLLLTHGQSGKQADYGIWMATEYPEQFGRTIFREIHVGHRHKSALDEKFGVRVRTFSALCPPDAWHAVNNFVGNLRTAEALIFNKDRGLIAQFYHNEVE